MLRRSRSLVFKHKHAPGNSTTLASASCATRPAFHHRLATEHPSAGLLITARGDSEHRVGEHKQSRSWGGGQPTAVCLSHTRTRPAVSATHRTRVTRQWLVWQVRGLTGRLPRYVAIVTWSSWTHHLGTGISHALHHPIYCFFPLSFHVDTPLCCGPPR